jgi:hypothetical protein
MLVELSDEELDQRLDEITGHSQADRGRRATARELYHRLRELERSSSGAGVVTLQPDTDTAQEMPAASLAVVGRRSS